MKKNPLYVCNIYSFILLLLPVFCCCENGYAQTSAKIKFSNSYVNVTRNATGGTVEPGDILEIRTTLYINATYNTTGKIYYLRYVDNLPANTAILSGSTLNLITNEGLSLKNYTQVPDADGGTFLLTPPAGEYQVKINMGGFPFGADPSAPADNSSTDITGASDLQANVNKPKFGGGTLVSTAFRVQVTGSIGDTVTLGDGHLMFKQTSLAGDPDTTISAIQYKILIAANDSVCSNTVGTNFADEFGGTFGNGNTLNRSTAPSFAIPGYTYVPNVSLYPSVSVNDGYYAVTNNSSPKSASNINARRQPSCGLPAGPIPAADSCNGRMFGGFWFISGDHTGTTDAIGNPPAAADSTGGYMLEVNADIATTEAYRQTISGLCPDTYYEFSAWVKNICPVCGLDSSGSQTWKPGVLPNLTLVVDNIDRYSSGEIDTLGWLKKGFLFKTNSGQTSITISIRDNAPGGGGNDWVLDDITLATCTPSLALLPSPTATVCYGNPVDISSLVSSHFDNYINWLWEKSTDNGATWTTTGISGIGSPVLVSGQWQYTATYPTFIGDSTTHNNLYRIKVASSVINLSDTNCSFSATTVVKVLVNNCMYVLKADLINTTGTLHNNTAAIQWQTVNESDQTVFQIEKSTDGSHFALIGKQTGNALNGKGNYTYNDPAVLTGPGYYRIKMIEKTGTKYSKTILLSPSALEFTVKNLVNPFTDNLSFDVILPDAGDIKIFILDNFGRVIKVYTQPASRGIVPVKINNLGGLSSGAYALKVNWQHQSCIKRILKITQ